MKRLMILNRIFGFLIGSILAAILLLALPIGCKSVQKTQSEKMEQSTVKKSDSSSSKSYSYVDTTKTDSSTTITKTEVTIDSIEYDYIPKGDMSIIRENIDTKLPSVYNIDINHPSGKAKAKGVKITTTTIKQAATQAKGVTIKEDVKQVDTNIDSGFAKRELSKETVKKPSIFMGMGLVFGLAIVIALIWLAIWVYRRKKKAAQLIAGKIF